MTLEQKINLLKSSRVSNIQVMLECEDNIGNIYCVDIDGNYTWDTPSDGNNFCDIYNESSLGQQLYNACALAESESALAKNVDCKYNLAVYFDENGNDKALLIHSDDFHGLWYDINKYLESEVL